MAEVKECKGCVWISKCNGRACPTFKDMMVDELKELKESELVDYTTNGWNLK
jgi:hypothetical protein